MAGIYALKYQTQLNRGTTSKGTCIVLTINYTLYQSRPICDRKVDSSLYAPAICHRGEALQYLVERILDWQNKGEGHVHIRTGHEGPNGEKRYTSTLL